MTHDYRTERTVKHMEVLLDETTQKYRVKDESDAVSYANFLQFDSIQQLLDQCKQHASKMDLHRSWVNESQIENITLKAILRTLGAIAFLIALSSRVFSIQIQHISNANSWWSRPVDYGFWVLVFYWKKFLVNLVGYIWYTGRSMFKEHDIWMHEWYI